MGCPAEWYIVRHGLGVAARWKDPISLCIIWCVWGRVGNTVADEKEVCKWVVEMWRDEFPVNVQDNGDGEKLGGRG